MMKGEVKESNDKVTQLVILFVTWLTTYKGSTVFNNYDKVYNQAARDININSQSFS
jgi:hypothetical protein